MVSSTTALNRAKIAKATFPKGKITVAQAKAMVLSIADSQVGYNPGSNVSIYGNGTRWATKGTWHWQGYWCARGISWVFDYCFGAEAAKAGIGKQPHSPKPAGWAATWLWRDWLRAKGLWVGLERAQPGDISMQSWGRTTNPTDHVELVTGKWNGSYYNCIGFNTVSQGTSGVTSGGGVWRVRRNRTALVAIYRPDWDALVKVYNASVAAEDIGKGIIDLTQYAQSLLDLGYPATEAGVKKFQKDEGLTEDGIVGPITSKALEDKVSEVLDAVKALERKFDQSDSVSVSDATARNLWTGRKGDQPRGWFLNLVGNRVGRIDQIVHDLREQSVKQAALTSGLTEAVRQLADKTEQPIDLDAITAASERGAQKALSGATVSLEFGDEDAEGVEG